MERNNYLNLCKECAMICDEGYYHKKENVPERLQVTYKYTKYYPVAYQLEFDKDGSVIHTAILHDLKANCMAYVPLKDVKYEERMI